MKTLSIFTLALAMACMISGMPVNKTHAFDINAYCRQVSDAAGGSYQIEEICRQEERLAKERLSRMQIPARIERY